MHHTAKSRLRFFRLKWKRKTIKSRYLCRCFCFDWYDSLINYTSDFANTCRTRLNTAPFDIPNKFIELAFYANSLYFWNTHKHRYHAMRKWYFRIKYGFVIKSSWHHLAEITIQYSFISSNIERPKSQRKNSTSTHHWTFSRFFFASSLNFAEDRLY